MHTLRITASNAIGFVKMQAVSAKRSDIRAQDKVQCSVRLFDKDTALETDEKPTLNGIRCETSLRVSTAHRTFLFATGASSAWFGLSHGKKHLMITSEQVSICLPLPWWIGSSNPAHRKFPFVLECIAPLRGQRTRYFLRFADEQVSRNVFALLRNTSRFTALSVLLRSDSESNSAVSQANPPHHSETDQSVRAIQNLPEQSQNPRNASVFTHAVELKALAHRLEILRELNVPLSIGVPTPGGFHSWRGVLHRVSIGDHGVKLAGARFALGIARASIRNAVIVSRPQDQAIRVSIEIYGHDQLPLCCVHGPRDGAEKTVWEEILNSLIVEIS